METQHLVVLVLQQERQIQVAEVVELVLFPLTTFLLLAAPVLSSFAT